MRKVQLPKVLYTCLLSIPMILIMSFLLPNLVHHMIHNLLSSTYELINVAKSSRVAVFVMFNVIFITVLLRSRKPSSAADFDDGYFLPSPVVVEVYSEKEEEDNEDYGSYEDDGYDEDNDDDLDTEDVDSEDDERTGNDLKERTEEFIAKVYKKRREESLAERLLLLEPPN